MKANYLSLVAILLASCNSSSSKWAETSAFLDFEDKRGDGADCPAFKKVKYTNWDPLQDEAHPELDILNEGSILGVRIDLRFYHLAKEVYPGIDYAPSDFDYLQVKFDGHSNGYVVGSLKGKNEYLLRVDQRCYYRFSID